jgi:hypothetical protein
MEAKDSIKQFYQTALDLLSTPESTDIPNTTLYHPAAVPSLLVHVGSVDRLPELRRQLPDHSFLLGLHPEGETVTESYCHGRTLTHPIDHEDECVQRVMLLTNILPEKKVQVITESGYRERYAGKCDLVEQAINTIVENSANDKRRGLIRLRSSCSNIRRMLDGPRVLPHKVSAEVPAVFCGAGPSLAVQLDQLKIMQGRVVIAAVGHAVQTLDRAGIVPDMIFESDPMAGRNWPEGLQPQSVLVATPEVAPDVVARFEHICWTAGSSMPITGLAEKYDVPLAKVTLGKTISVQALDFMQRMGFRNIALLGQDYCLGEEGQMYAESSETSTIDEYFRLPAANGNGTVVTDRSLQGLYEAINRYLSTVDKISGLKLVNVSGGAALEGTEVAQLDEWFRSMECADVPALFSVESIDICTAMLSSTITELKAGLQQLDLILKNTRSLTNELERHPIRMENVKRKQKALECEIQSGETVRQQVVCAPILHTLFHHADEIMKETPGMITEDPDPVVQLHYLTRRYGLVKRLYNDVLTALEKGADPLSFSAFLQENRATLKRCNPDFAERVMEFNDVTSPDFDVRCFNQLVPYVKRKVDGAWKELSAFSSMFREAADVVDSFVKETGFDPQNDALTVVAPGNWVYVLEFLRRYPMLELAILEPWPELLGQLMSRGCFLHQLPANALVVETWANSLYMQRRGRWNQMGMRKTVFVSPHVENMPDVKAWVRNLEVLP